MDKMVEALDAAVAKLKAAIDADEHEVARVYTYIIESLHAIISRV